MECTDSNGTFSLVDVHAVWNLFQRRQLNAIENSVFHFSATFPGVNALPSSDFPIVSMDKFEENILFLSPASFDLFSFIFHISLFLSYVLFSFLLLLLSPPSFSLP
jgi:hypothetical protein